MKKEKKCKHNKSIMEAQQFSDGKVIYFCRKCDKWIKKNELTDDMIEEIKKEITRSKYNPKISMGALPVC